MSNYKVTMGGNPITLIGDKVNVGDKAPDFKVIDGSLKQVKLSDFRGKVKLLSVFPSIDTGVCSIQTRKFNKQAASFGDKVAFIGLSADLPFALKRFCGTEEIDNILTLSDHKDMEFGQKFGFQISEFRLLARGVVVIDKNDEIKYIEVVPEVGQEPNYESAISKVKELL